MSIWGKLPPWAVLVLIGLLGLILIIAPNLFKWNWDYGVIHDVGISLVAASVLAFTIDRWMKAELRTDAFKAALGHVLRPEFRAEVSRIIGYKLLCERHFLIVNIEKEADEEVVKVTSSVERTIRNVSSYPEAITNYVFIDEWGFRVGSSDILECSLTTSGKPISFLEKKRDDFTVRADTEKITLSPGQTAEMHSRWVEYKRINDINFYHFAIPTIDPEIEVHCPNELDCSFGFGTADQNVEPYHYVTRKKLRGTYFPHQNMSARWWPKKKGA